MRTIRLAPLTATALALAATAALTAAPILFTSPAWAGAEKVQVCHVPPGDPSNRHTISVGPKAAEAHLANHRGDQLGECPPRCDDGTACDDANPCTINGCVDGFCDFSQPVECEEGSTCTTNVCLPDQGGCVEIPANEGGLCNDGVVCTENDRCQSGMCAGDDRPSCCRNDAACNDLNACTDDVCDEATGGCSNTPVTCPEPQPCEVSLCDAQNGCTTAPVVCANDGDICTDEFCDPTVGETGACVTVAATPPEPTEVSCTDRLDNDCDGRPDGLDSDCQTSCREECDEQHQAALQACEDDFDACCPSGCSALQFSKCDDTRQTCRSTADTDHNDCLDGCPTFPPL